MMSIHRQNHCDDFEVLIQMQILVTFNGFPIGPTSRQQIWLLSAEEVDLSQTWPGATQILHHAEFQIRRYLEPLL